MFHVEQIGGAMKLLAESNEKRHAVLERSRWGEWVFRRSYKKMRDAKVFAAKLNAQGYQTKIEPW